MKKRIQLSIILLAMLSWASAQKPLDSVYLLRMPDKQHDFIRIPNTGVYFIQKAGLKPGHFGWQLPDEFVPSDGDMLYFEMSSTDVPPGPWDEYTGGSLQLVIDLPHGITALNLDTLDRLEHHLVNNYADRGHGQENNQLSGVLQFAHGTDNTVTITGAIEIKTTRPYKTRQQIVYRDADIPVMSLLQHGNAEMQKQERQQQLEKAAEALETAIAHEKEVFYDSLFTKEMAKRNALSAVRNKNQRFSYGLNESYILTGAILGRGAKGSLTDMLGRNFLETTPGTGTVFLLHSFDDPDPHVIDDETNYSLGIEVDSPLVPGKTFVFNRRDAVPGTILGYWHWGAFGHPVLSKKVEGTVTVSSNIGGVVSGKLDLTFYFGKEQVRITGDYLLPTVPLAAVMSFKAQLAQKYGDQLGQ